MGTGFYRRGFVGVGGIDLGWAGLGIDNLMVVSGPNCTAALAAQSLMALLPRLT